jgi:serine protease inhibitor
VNEKGTEAFAATAIRAPTSCAFIPVEKPKFIADHPFAYMINGGRPLQGSAAVLFNGTYRG